MTKDTRDSMNILEKAELIKRRAKQIEKKHRTISKLQAFNIASEEVLGDSLWNA